MVRVRAPVLSPELKLNYYIASISVYVSTSANIAARNGFNIMGLAREVGCTCPLCIPLDPPLE